MTSIIQNVVSTANYGAKLDLMLIAQHAYNIEYNPNKFIAAIIKLRSPKTTTLLFSSGNVVCTGGKSIHDNKKASRRIARTVQKIYKKYNPYSKIIFSQYNVQNLVGSFSLGFNLDLIAFNYDKPTNSFYDATIFPGLKFKPFKTQKTTILLFISGKVIITGIKDEETLNEAQIYMARLALRYKRPFPYTTC